MKNIFRVGMFICLTHPEIHAEIYFSMSALRAVEALRAG
jgi:hypothetical protein